MKIKIFKGLCVAWGVMLLLLVIFKWKVVIPLLPILALIIFCYLCYLTLEGLRKKSLTEIIKDINKKQKETKKQ